MNHTISIAALLSALSLAACDRPAVVTVPSSTTPVAVPVPVPVPGPAGATGATGSTGSTGSTGATGQPGDTTVIVVPPAGSAPSR